ncbi:hypothetical protein [Demequina oxidasica]|uniref:hypothetical protein n=1 Tax=Demequina oxidasica TaxID=676199 RepID=UPI00128B575D|nr:hypothetical protein [Demequina oxidasica]
MTTLHSAITRDSLPWARKTRAAAVGLALVVALAGCSPSSENEPATSNAQPSATAGSDLTDAIAEDSNTLDAGPVDESSEADGADEATEEAPGAGGPIPDDVGNATLYVDGVEFNDFTGDCEISREHGKKDVGDLNEGDISAIIAIDNVKAHEDMAMNYVAINEERFRFGDPLEAAGVGGPRNKGEILTMTEKGPRGADGSRDIVEVRFAGVLEDGTEINADVICELQNAF